MTDNVRALVSPNALRACMARVTQEIGVTKEIVMIAAKHTASDNRTTLELAVMIGRLDEIGMQAKKLMERE